MEDSYREVRNKFMHTNGTTPYETFLTIVPSFSYTILTSLLISLVHSFHTTNAVVTFLIEFATLAIPLILNVTVLADYTVELFLTTIIICGSMLTVIQGLKTSSPTTPQSATTQGYVTNARSTINIISVIAILAVDFRIFPRRFAKTENFGYSLMDVGVGLFIYSNGIVDRGKTDLWKSLKGSLPLIILGVGRFFVTREINYHVPESEYGLHWNFFLTLAVIKIFVSLLFAVINVKFIWINAALLLISHEILLESGLKNFVLRNAKRVNFISANKEGIISLLGYVSLYLFSAYFGHVLNLKTQTNAKVIIPKFVLLSSLSLFSAIVLEQNFGISRKLANAAYCAWVLFIGIFMTGLFYIGEKIEQHFLKNKLPSCIYAPVIFQAINYNGLAFFLISNLLTGLINVACDTLKLDPITSLVINIFYMLVNCGIVCILYRKQIKLKF